MRIVTALLFISILALSSAPTAALAHARPAQAEPAHESSVASVTEIKIWFTQELTLRGNDIVVSDGAGNRVDNADARVDQDDPDRKLLRATVQPLVDGLYTVTWTSSSAEDGHPATDSYSFTVAGAAQDPAVSVCSDHAGPG
ncbi:MAG: copper resistance protein CopC [Chloroflexota bacterium]